MMINYFCRYFETSFLKLNSAGSRIISVLLQLIQYLSFGLFAGLLSWNVLECHVDLEEELNNLLNHGPEGELARHGMKIFFSFLSLTPT